MNRVSICIFLVLINLITASCKKRVAAAPTPSPVQPSFPLSSPQPVISLTADRTAVEQGDSATLSWKTENATSVEITELGGVELTGSVQVSPRVGTTYTATATGPGGTATEAVRITVNMRPDEPAAAAPGRAITLDEDFRNNVGDVYFEYDRATLRMDQIGKLEVLLGWMREHPDTRVVVEGHGDERGSEEYNLGLGVARASAARTYLADAGIDPNRLDTISYGEERPICREETEICWSRNRRAHFVLNTR